MVKQLLTPARVAALAALTLHLSPVATLADSVVTLCHQDDEGGPGLNLETALQTGGQITFSCGGLATIRITKSYLIDKSIDISGADNITLDAESRQLTMFQVVSNGLTLSLSHLTLRRARLPGVLSGGLTRLSSASVISTPPLDPFVPIKKDFSHGTSLITLQSVDISENESPVFIGNSDSDVTLRVKNTQFRANTGYALYVTGSAELDHSSFVANETGLGIGDGGGARVSSCKFSANKSNGVKLAPFGTLNLDHSEFQGNTGTSGAGILIDGNANSADLRNVEFNGNVATANGGAIAITQGAVRVKMVYVDFVGNSAARGGSVDADLAGTNSLTIFAARFEGNHANSQGGALYSGPGKVLVAGSIFKGNSAVAGSALFVLASAQQPMVVANTLLVRNTGAGAAIEGIQLDLRNVTIAENQGGGIRARNLALARATGAGIALQNTIVSRNAPFNCGGFSNLIVFKSQNIQFPADPACHGVSAAEPLLDSIFAPLPGSPAYGTGDLNSCMGPPVDGRDLFFQQRGVGGVCSMGALEFAPEQFMAWRARYNHTHNGNQNPNSPHP
jgi:predicted outer membrane repeat protein